MNFRFSPGNVVSGIGVLVVGVAGNVLYRHYAEHSLESAIDSLPGSRSDVQQFVYDIPVWIPVVVAVVGLIIILIGRRIQNAASVRVFAELAEYAEGHGWMLLAPPRWVGESRTFPMDSESGFDATAAWAGDYRGHWGTSLLVTTESGLKGNEAPTTFQVIGFPFNDDMPRLQVIPRDAVQKARDMRGSKPIAFEAAEFNARWSVRGEDAKRVHDILHPRTLERLLKSDVDAPVVIDAGAIWSWRATPVTGADFERAMDVLVDVAEGIPAFLYADLNVQFLRKESDDLHADWVNSRRSASIEQKDEFDTIG